MLDKKSLEKFGANVDEGLARCMNNDTFYFGLVKKAAEDTSVEKLEAALAAGDLETAFETAHTMKGVLGNLSITSIYQPICEITELLRARTEMDYGEYVKKIKNKYEELRKLCEQ